MKLNRQQAGLSLVELMIALVIGSFLILGATQLYLSSKQNQLFASSSAENLDGARYSTMVLDEELSKAGFRRAPDQNMTTAFPSASISDCKNFAAGSAIAPLSNGSSNGFCFRYQPATNDETSCSGQQVGVSRAPFSPSPSSELVYVIISFEEGDELQDGALRCTSIQGNSDPESDIIIDGVADFRVFMAEGDPTERRLQSAELKLASAIGANAIVRAMGYEILLASGPNRRDGESKVFTEYLSGLDQARRTELQSKDKRHVYQVATGGQAIRNLMP